MNTLTAEQQIALAILNGQNVAGQSVCVVTHYHAGQLQPATPSRFTLTGHFTSMEQVQQCLADPCTASRGEAMSR